jgi:endo-1,4-beta-D-glucanase Y
MSWKGRITTSAGAPSGALRVVDPMGPPANRTVSEGIGYGMLIAVYFADKTVFDELWAYASAHMSNGLMSWQIDSTGALVNGDTHSATDADEDMAWALLMADKQWGGTYLSSATTLIKAIRAEEVSSTFQLQGGDFTGGPTYYDYAAPAYYAGFATATGDASWNQIFTAEYTQLIGVQNGTTGLTPDSNETSSFSYDAVRSPWRIGVDYSWQGTAQAQTY